MKILFRYFMLLSIFYIVTINTMKINRRPEREITRNVKFANTTHHHMHMKYFTMKQENITSNDIKYNSQRKLNYGQIEKSDKATIDVHHFSFSNKSTNVTIKLFKEKKIIKLLFISYILVAVPLWCTKGWCCCFLFCKIFKPDKTIEEAKKFLELNPPGVLFLKETLIHYEPSANEKYCYEKLEHIIRTI